LDAILTILGNLFSTKIALSIMIGSGISVAMCTFNGSRFLQAQLDSIAAQRRRPDELVICDDQSSDGTKELIAAFAQRSPFPVRFSVNKQRLGSTKNFEAAIMRCRQSIVALADQDDVWYAGKIQAMEKVFSADHSAVAAFSDADLIDADSRPLPLRLWSTVAFSASQQRQFDKAKAFDVLLKHPVITGATMAFRKEHFSLLTPIPADEVHDRWISFLLAARGPIRIIRQPLMQYRRHEHQQIGPGPADFQAKMQLARDRGVDFYADEIARYSRLRDHMSSRQSQFAFPEHAMEKLETKLIHLQHRARLPKSKVARVPRLLGETMNGRYWRYSGGLKSVAKDLIVR
jgi:glycosyltransferase involved in cell wall biosynthesis